MEVFLLVLTCRPGISCKVFTRDIKITECLLVFFFVLQKNHSLQWGNLNRKLELRFLYLIKNETKNNTITKRGQNWAHSKPHFLIVNIVIIKILWFITWNDSSQIDPLRSRSHLWIPITINLTIRAQSSHLIHGSYNLIELDGHNILLFGQKSESKILSFVYFFICFDF